jgi:hypothetical protein
MHCGSTSARGFRVLRACSLALATVIALTSSATAADPAAKSGGDRISRDLFSVLALRGKPCGRVVEAQKQAEDDYLVRCEDGHRYRIRIDGERVVIEAR